MIKNFLNPEGHQNPISGSKVKAILLEGLIWPIGEASAGQGLRLQPAQQACFNHSWPFSVLVTKSPEVKLSRSCLQWLAVRLYVLNLVQ